MGRVWRLGIHLFTKQNQGGRSSYDSLIFFLLLSLSFTFFIQFLFFCLDFLRDLPIRRFVGLRLVQLFFFYSLVLTSPERGHKSEE
jgi:hypothetical protein